MPLPCDRDRIDQVIGNLISNALKYSPVESSVRVDVHADGSSAVVAVTDAGIGIPEAERELVFQPFYRALGFDECEPMEAPMPDGSALPIIRMEKAL